MKKAFLLSLFTSFQTFAAMDIPQIIVQGYCEINVSPDRGKVTFMAENQSMDQTNAVNKTNHQINKLKDLIKELNLKNLELKNTHYSVYPVREWAKDKMIEKGFRAALTLEMTTSDIQRIGEAMQKGSAAGITNVGALSTFLSLEESHKEYLKCLDIAADDAKSKAIQLGKKLGFKIGDVISLNEVPNSERPSYPETAMMKSINANSESVATQIEPGTLQYSSNIQVTFSIK